MNKAGKFSHQKNKLIALALVLPLTGACGCSFDYVNYLDSLKDTVGRITDQGSDAGFDADFGVQDALADGFEDSVSEMGMTRSINDVFVSAGSGDVSQITDEDLQDIGVRLEEAGEDAPDPEDEKAREEIGARTRDIPDFPDSKYAFSKLNAHEKKVYEEISKTIHSLSDETEVSSLDVDEIDKCFNCVMIDNPDYFYTDGYRMTRTLVNGELESISFSPRYTMTGREILEKEDYIDDYVNRFVAGMPDLPDEYSKAKYIFDYLVDNTEYDIGSENSQNICSVFVNNKSVCQGYAMAAKYLADELGIFCTIVYGNAGGENHAWNLMRLDGTCCHVDITWGDTSYRNTSEGTDGAMKDYVFLGASDDLIKVNHTVDSIVELPVCDSLDSYYFVREGRYFTREDHDKLREVFDRAYTDNEDILTVRCADSEVYDDMDDFLFTEGNVFRYLRGNGKARFVRNREELTLSVLLT